MHPRTFLRLEGLAVLSASLAGYFTLDGPLWLFAVLALAPDLSMLGYLFGGRVGSLTYNVFHTYALPLALVVVGLQFGVDVAVLVALVWASHIGADRLVGYGLKFESGFGDTHLSPRPEVETAASVK
ncbi:DUF4260 domain-containing protein [Halobellus rarus]|uniref:DUF4260 domain-containing protein n=1 Tax=Halobellus rarus TaxID=1126237 RepID=A0ABD6CPD5_9EURY|nr:DUF4260 domain-containing protein [Halobellus rarus]